MNGRFILIALLLAYFGCTLSTAQILPTADSRTVARAGHLNGSKTEYKNDYFGISVRLPHRNSSVVINLSVESDRVLLLKAVNDQPDVHEWHKFGIEAQSANIPRLSSITQFVQSVRHQQEREGFQTVQAEGYRTIAGREFVVSQLKIESQKENYYQAIMFTRTKGYLLGFWIDAKTREELEKAMNLEDSVRFE